MTDLERQIAELIWTTSRADEGTISATGANIIAAALLPLIREREAAAWERALREVRTLADEWKAEGGSLVMHAYSGRDVHEGQTLERCAYELRDRAAANPYAGSEGA